MRVLLILMVMGCGIVHPATGKAQQTNLLDIGTRSQLLLNRDLVYESHQVVFTQHAARKHPDNPLMTADQPWEGRYVSSFGGTVLYDESAQLFKMWYTCGSSPDYFDHRGICYATSRDGLTWNKPLVGQRKAKNDRPHNSLLPVDTPSVFLDSRDEDPARRYKMICFDVDRGYMAFLSPDGLRWTEQSSRPIVPISYVDDVISAFYDRATGEFVALPKMMTPVFGRLRRSIYQATSRDFRHWSKPEPALFADRRDDLGTLARLERVRPLLRVPDNINVMRTEIYGAGAYVAESCTIGFPWVFTVSANVPRPGNQEGPIEVQMAISRDRETWQRPFRTPVIPLGKPGAWDGGMILTASQAIDVGDEVRLYYAGHSRTHAGILDDVMPPAGRLKKTGAIGLATWRRDRFGSADGSTEDSHLTTVPLKFEGHRLEVNANVQPGGKLQVEILDPAGQPINGCTISEPVTGDSLRQLVVFPELENLAEVAGQPVCLRFHLQNARLFAFAFRKTTE